MSEEILYKGIPVKEDKTLRDDELVVSGLDASGQPVTMRFRYNAEGKLEVVGD